jgi:antitoxin component YwqK of YwqJK toxin-antitoxin module
MTSKFISVYHFVNGEQEGIQKEYYTENNTLARVYTLYKSSNYRGEYTCYNQNGKIIYQENFGKDGTGYYKKFDNEIVIREGKLVKDRPVGIHIFMDYFQGDIPLIDETFYNEQGRFYKVKLYGNLKALYETDGDSMIYDYDKNITNRRTFLKGKLIKSEQFNDTLLSL